MARGLSRDEKAKLAKEKTKVRRIGPSLLRKSKDLGTKAQTFSIAAYWELTHKEYRLRMHLPEGWSIPDINSMMAAAASSPAQAESPGAQRSQAPQKPSNRVEKPRQQALRRSARQRARLHASQASGIDPYEFTGTPEPGNRQSNQDNGPGTPGFAAVEETGRGSPVDVNEAEESGRFSVGNESLHPSGNLEAAQETAQEAEVERQGAEEPQSDAPGEVDLDAMASASADIAHMSENGFGAFDPPQNISSPFGSSSWMDIDFLGDLSHGTEFNNQDVQELQQGSDVPRPAVSGLPGTGAPRPGPNMAWWKLAQESLSLLKKIMSPQKEMYETEL